MKVLKTINQLFVWITLFGTRYYITFKLIMVWLRTELNQLINVIFTFYFFLLL